MEQKSLEQALREQADKLARAEERKVSTFLSALAHELRSPLSPMLSSVHVARRTEDTSQRERALEILERQLGHLAKLLDNLLEVARVSTGRIKLHRERIDLARLIRTSAEDYRPTLEEAHLALQVRSRFFRHCSRLYGAFCSVLVRSWFTSLAHPQTARRSPEPERCSGADRRRAGRDDGSGD